ncbi:TPA: hypothetical protein ACH3X1_004331 [Trebouxia sp. C0004]
MTGSFFRHDLLCKLAVLSCLHHLLYTWNLPVQVCQTVVPSLDIVFPLQCRIDAAVLCSKHPQQLTTAQAGPGPELLHLQGGGFEHRQQTYFLTSALKEDLKVLVDQLQRLGKEFCLVRMADQAKGQAGDFAFLAGEIMSSLEFPKGS